MRIIPLEIGRLDSDLSIITGEDRTTPFPIPSWLIEHRDGLVLFDTGLHASLQHDPERLGDSARWFTPDFDEGEDLTAQLDSRGVRTSDITHIVFSHLHFDHAGGTCEIPDARVVVQQAEWEAGQDQKLIDRGTYNPEDYRHGHDVQQVDGDHDLFGDGAVQCISTPGHTPGHQSLRVVLDSGPVVLTADCIYFRSMFDEMQVPKFGYKADMQLESMQRLKSMSDAGDELIFGHDMEQFRSLPAEGLA